MRAIFQEGTVALFIDTLILEDKKRTKKEQFDYYLSVTHLINIQTSNPLKNIHNVSYFHL